MDRNAEDAAATLGAGPAYRFRRVTLPSVAPALAAGAALTWARALGEFGATITFAGNLQGTTQTLPLFVYVTLEGSDPDAAIAALRDPSIVDIYDYGVHDGREGGTRRDSPVHRCRHNSRRRSRDAIG